MSLYRPYNPNPKMNRADTREEREKIKEMIREIGRLV